MSRQIELEQPAEGEVQRHHGCARSPLCSKLPQHVGACNRALAPDRWLQQHSVRRRRQAQPPAEPLAAQQPAPVLTDTALLTAAQALIAPAAGAAPVVSTAAAAVPMVAPPVGASPQRPAAPPQLPAPQPPRDTTLQLPSHNWRLQPRQQQRGASHEQAAQQCPAARSQEAPQHHAQQRQQRQARRQPPRPQLQSVEVHVAVMPAAQPLLLQLCPAGEATVFVQPPSFKYIRRLAVAAANLVRVMLRPPPGSADDADYFQLPSAYWAKAPQLRRILLRNSADDDSWNQKAAQVLSSWGRPPDAEGGIAVPLFLVPSVAGLRHLGGLAAQSDTATLQAVWPDAPADHPTTAPGAAGVTNAAGVVSVTAVEAPVLDISRSPAAAAAAAAANAARNIATSAAAAAAAAASHDVRVRDLRAIASNLTRLAAGPDLRGALLAMAYLAQYPMTAPLLRGSLIGASVLPLRRHAFMAVAEGAEFLVQAWRRVMEEDAAQQLHAPIAPSAGTGGGTLPVSSGTEAPPLQRAPSHQQWPRTDLSLRLY